MDGADLELFERSLRHATETSTGAQLDAALAELGWHDAFGAVPRAAVSLLFELQGAANVTSSALDQVLGSAMGGEVAGATVVLPALGSWDPPGWLDGEQLTVGGIATARITDHDTAVVVATRGDQAVAITVDTAALTLRTVDGVDPWFGIVEVGGSPPGTDGEPVDWPAAVALGRLAIGHELVGASRKMLELAREHALERIQFGQPISTFQAVRHRLAETLVAIETADTALATAWDEGSHEGAAMAKALAGRSARAASRHCQQVLAGIGFTTEHSFHRYARRVLVLDGLFGAAKTLTRELGEELIRTRHLPPFVPL